MAMVTATLVTDSDAVNDLIEAENDTQAHKDAMYAAIKASQVTITELIRLQTNVSTILDRIGNGQVQQPAAPLN